MISYDQFTLISVGEKTHYHHIIYLIYFYNTNLKAVKGRAFEVLNPDNYPGQGVSLRLITVFKTRVTKYLAFSCND